MIKISRIFKNPLTHALLLLGFWSVIGLLFLLQSYIYGLNFDRPFNWARAIPYVMSGYWLWALLTPGVYWLSRKFPLDRISWRKNVPIHLCLSLIIAPLHRYLTTLVSFTVHQQIGILNKGIGEALSGAWVAIIGGSITSLAMYWILVFVFVSFNYYQKYQKQRLQFSQLETQLAEARLQALKMQLHPHFLFNTLNAISSLMDEDVRTARKMMARLSELLRLALENTGAQKVLLKNELDFLERYLEIEKMRFPDRLSVQFEIAPETLIMLVPNLLLQPIVENAVRHGIAPDSTAGQLVIRACQLEKILHIEVQDDGTGILQGKKKSGRKGMGLENVKKRLYQLYGIVEGAKLQNISPKGLLVKIDIPIEYDETSK